MPSRRVRQRRLAGVGVPPSGGGSTATVTVLTFASGVVSFESMTAVFTVGPVREIVAGFTVVRKVTEPLEVSVPRFQVTVPLANVPPLAASRKVNPATWSVITAPVTGPLVNVYETVQVTTDGVATRALAGPLIVIVSVFATLSVTRVGTRTMTVDSSSQIADARSLRDRRDVRL